MITGLSGMRSAGPTGDNNTAQYESKKKKKKKKNKKKKKKNKTGKEEVSIPP
jgi:hypothetical protein